MRTGMCVHYTGRLFADDPTALCAQGIDIRATFPAPPSLLRAPCFCNGTDETGRTCEKFRGPTPEEIAAHDKEVDEAIEKMLGVHRVVGEWMTTAPWVDGRQSGIMDCPRCKAVGALTVLATTRRAYVRCSTPGCAKYEANLGHRKEPKT